MLFHQESWMNSLVSPTVYLGVPTLWVLGVYFMINTMMKKPPMSVKMAMRIYNVVQIVVCGYMVWGLFPCLGLPNFCGINSEFDARGEWFVFVHYLSKYLDWFDTLWILLNKKRTQLSFLHIYHHATIVMVWGFLLDQNVGAGTCRYGAWVNSLTHVIMYSHYLWTSFGLKNPFKKYITMWQITQFYSCLLHAFLVLFLETTTVHTYAPLQVVYQLSMVYLFSYQLSWVPTSIPDFNAKSGEISISCLAFCSPQGDEDDVKTNKKKDGPAPVKSGASTPKATEAAGARKRASTPTRTSTTESSTQES